MNNNPDTNGLLTELSDELEDAMEDMIETISRYAKGESK